MAGPAMCPNAFTVALLLLNLASNAAALMVPPENSNAPAPLPASSAQIGANSTTAADEDGDEDYDSDGQLANGTEAETTGQESYDMLPDEVEEAVKEDHSGDGALEAEDDGAGEL